ncbi:MAG: hypothetical protein AAB608_01160 [Patescibacteria group bacterium]
MPKLRQFTATQPRAILYQGAKYAVAGLFRREGEEFVTFCGESGIERSVPLAKVSVIA